MSPYRALFSNPFDLAVTWLFVTVWLVVGTILLHSQDRVRHTKTVGYCWPAARAFLYLCAVIAVIFAVGLVFLVWLRIASSFWLIWQLFWLMSVICVFWVLPCFATVLVGWALIERWRGRLQDRAVFIMTACPLGVALNAAMYFALNWFMV